MGYEDARSTKLLASHCICCGRPLRDPLSVETGVGPICRQKYGYATQGNPETRAACSKLIHAAAQKGLSAIEVYAYADKIEALGFDGVALRVRERFAKAYEWETEKKAKPLVMKRDEYTIRGTKYDNAIFLHTPYEKGSTKAFNAAFKEAVPAENRTGTKDNRGTFWWVIAPHHARDLHGVLLAHFDGRLVKVQTEGRDNFIVGEAERIKKEKAAEEASAILNSVKADKGPLEGHRERTEEEIREEAARKAQAILEAIGTKPTPVPVPTVNAPADLEEDWGDLD